jgi:DNA-binding transcriptional LysR family regulator
MDSGDLALFAAVAKAGGITRAAQALNTVQSNVTHRIQLLEAELGVPLFHRHTRGVTLTSAGEKLLPYAERIARLIGEAREAAADGPVARGKVAIGSLETTAALRLPPVLASYAAACPEVDIEIATGTTAAMIEAVLSHRVEAAFVAGPVDHPELVAVPVVEEELVLATAPWIDDLSKLRDQAGQLKIVVFRAGCTYRVYLERLLAARGLVDVRRLEFGTLDGLVGCVSAGIGVTLLPRAVLAKAESEGRVALHAMPDKDTKVTTVLVRRADGFVSTALRRFIETAQDFWRERAPEKKVAAARIAPQTRRSPRKRSIR